MGADTKPIDNTMAQNAPRLMIAPSWTDPVSGAVYVHENLMPSIQPWENESHISPIRETRKFGDVESWGSFVTRYASEEVPPLLTWSERGLCAVLDYHGEDGTPNRCQWRAEHPFEHSAQWNAWSRLADGRARTQRQVIEALEDLAEDIVEPAPASIVGILRTLRATVSAKADTELRQDGTTTVNWSKDQRVKTGELSLPPEIGIAIPVLKGHIERTDDGKSRPVLYRLAVRIRVSVDDEAALAFRLSMPTAERVFEAVLADRVETAERFLGDKFVLLRAAA